MTKSHWCDRLRPICSGGGGRGRLRACGMRGMNRCDMAVVCTDVCNAWNVGAKCGMSPDVVLECRECGRGSANSCMTTGHWFYSYLYRLGTMHSVTDSEPA